MKVKKIPIKITDYYQKMKKDMTDKRNMSNLEKAKLIRKAKDLKESIEANIDSYKTKFDIDLTKYSEFVNNEYTTGTFLRLAKGAYLNKGNDYVLVGELIDLLDLANIQKEMYDLDKTVALCNKCINLTFAEYNNILKLYYTEVHKKLILEGQGYAFIGRTGWICCNRILINQKRKTLDYANTKKREAELKAQGARIYNKEEAEWCRKNGIEYIAEDKRVYRTAEHGYEIPLIGSKLPNGIKLKLTITDYRHKSCRGKTNEDLIRECNNDTSLICNLPVDLKTKLTLCDAADKLLYTKLIRNEDQKSYAFRKIDRQD